MLMIKGLSKTYGNGVRALQEVGLHIERGMFGLLGPNGAGKSSLMRTIATLQTPDKGQIHFDDIDVLKHPTKLRSRLGYLPQEFGVYPRISALHLLDHFAVMKGILDKTDRKHQIENLLQQTNLWQARKKSVHNFSGGMKRRFGIAQALLGDPQLVIVDEPTAGLDPEERKRFLNLLSEIGENVVVILSTHIVEDVRDLCSKMAIMQQGRVILQGIPNQLIDDLDGRIWRKKIEKQSLPDYRQQHSVISTHLLAGETRIHVQADSCPAQGFEAISPDLEDVYFSALNRAA